MDRDGDRDALLWLSCWVVLLVLIGVDWSLQDVVLSGAYGLVAVLAGGFLAMRRVWIMVAVVVGAAALSFLWNHNVDSTEWFLRLLVAVTLSAAALLIAGARERREHRLAQMTLIAQTAQRAILRDLPSALGDVAFAARYVSAAEEALVGGDLYEVAATPFGTRAIVGDVRGKGLDAVQLAATVLSAFRAAAETIADLAAVARELDVAVSGVADVEDFVTAVLVQFGTGGSLQVVNVAHLPPLLIEPTGVARVHLMDTGESVPPLGMHPEPTITRTTWGVGSRLLLYTDGTTESRDQVGQFFEITAHARSLSQGSPDQALDRLIAALRVHVGHQLTDDIALVLAERRADPIEVRGGTGTTRVPPRGQ